jgi:peptidylprolyl isomerase
VPCPWLDGKHVVFGEVKEGYDIVQKMEDEGDSRGNVRNDITIKDCGEVKA